MWCGFSGAGRGWQRGRAPDHDKDRQLRGGEASGQDQRAPAAVDGERAAAAQPQQLGLLHARQRRRQDLVAHPGPNPIDINVLVAAAHSPLQISSLLHVRLFL